MNDEHIRNMLRRGTISSVDDSGGQQFVGLRGLAAEKFEGVHRIQPFGFTSTPPSDAVGVIAALGGRNDRAVFLGGEHVGKRPKNIGSGATAIYDADGNIVSVVADKITLLHKTKIRIVVGSMVVAISANRIDLGADPAPYRVGTEAGLSNKVFAVI